jgi:hypothetical protein
MISVPYLDGSVSIWNSFYGIYYQAGMQQKAIPFVAFIIHSPQLIVTGANAAYVSAQVNLSRVLNTNQILTRGSGPAVSLQVGDDVLLAYPFILQEAVATFGFCFRITESADGLATLSEQVSQYPIATIYQTAVP